MTFKVCQCILTDFVHIFQDLYKCIYPDQDEYEITAICGVVANVKLSYLLLL